MWHENFTNIFWETLQEYPSVDLMLGSFVPREEPRVSKSKLFPKVATPQVITPPLAPKYFKNPSYTVVDITKKDKRRSLVFKNFIVRAFDV